MFGGVGSRAEVTIHFQNIPRSKDSTQWMFHEVKPCNIWRFSPRAQREEFCSSRHGVQGRGTAVMCNTADTGTVLTAPASPSPIPQNTISPGPISQLGPHAQVFGGAACPSKSPGASQLPRGQQRGRLTGALRSRQHPAPYLPSLTSAP